jgi:hypothetical protein
MAVEFKDTQENLSQALTKTIHSISGETVSLRQLFELIGEQGLWFLCALLCIPFLIPVSIPGVSTVFGAAIILIGIAILMNRIPWLPKRIMDRPLATAQLIPTLEKGMGWVNRIDRFIRPRMLGMTEGAVMNRVNGLALVFAGVLLIFPFGFIPFSNTLPALAILFLVVGVLQRDGVFVLLGYLMMVVTIAYFAFLIGGAIVAGASLGSLLKSG